MGNSTLHRETRTRPRMLGSRPTRNYAALRIADAYSTTSCSPPPCGHIDHCRPVNAHVATTTWHHGLSPKQRLRHAAYVAGVLIGLGRVGVRQLASAGKQPGRGVDEVAHRRPQPREHEHAPDRN
eukprot:1364081-Prymnesium_polylepis.1